MRQRTLGLALVLLASACVPTTKPPPEASAAPPHQEPRGRTLLPTAEGSWQVFDLPLGWAAHFLGEPYPLRAYISLAPVDPADIEGDPGSPCPAPQRIVLGVVEADQARRERTLACLEVCGPEGGETLYRGLFGSATHLQGVTAELLEDGSIDLVEHYRELAFMTPEVAEDPTVVDKLSYQGAPKLLHRTITPSEFRFKGRVAAPCVAPEK